jgi:hypothetical protein
MLERWVPPIEILLNPAAMASRPISLDEEVRPYKNNAEQEKCNLK